MFTQITIQDILAIDPGFLSKVETAKRENNLTLQGTDAEIAALNTKLQALTQKKNLSRKQLKIAAKFHK